MLAALPPLVIRNDLEEGRLVRVLPEWNVPEQKLHVIYQSRQGLTLAARTLEGQTRPSGTRRGA